MKKEKNQWMENRGCPDLMQLGQESLSAHLDQHVADLLVALCSCCMKRGAFVLVLHQKIGVLPINCELQSWVCQCNKQNTELLYWNLFTLELPRRWMTFCRSPCFAEMYSCLAGYVTFFGFKLKRTITYKKWEFVLPYAYSLQSDVKSFRS